MQIDDSAKIYTLLGWIFECAVKSGFLNDVVHRFEEEGPNLVEASCFENRSFDEIVSDALVELGSVGHPALKRDFLAKTDYVRTTGYLQGQMFSREVFGDLQGADMAPDVTKIFCPFPSMPREGVAADSRESCRQVQTALKLEKTPSSAGRGRLPNADLLLEIKQHAKKVRRYAVDISLFSQAAMGVEVRSDSPEDHAVDHYGIRHALASQVISEQGRAPFTGVEILYDEEFMKRVTPEVARFYAAFASKEKPFYKVCQAASYMSDWVAQAPVKDKGKLYAIALTNFGIEGLDDEYSNSPSWAESNIMKDLGLIYQEIEKGDPRAFAKRKQQLFSAAYNRISSRLPKGFLRAEDFELPFSESKRRVEYCGSELFESDPDDLTEEMLALKARGVRKFPGFVNPSTPLADPKFAGTAAEYPRRTEAAGDFVPSPGMTPTLRSIHSAGIAHFFSSYKQSEPTVLLLLGHPGIGKTTSTIQWIKNNSSKRTLLLYSSPRIGINESLSSKVKDMDGFVLLTTNSAMISLGIGCENSKEAAEYLSFNAETDSSRALVGTACSSNLESDGVFSSSNECFFRPVEVVSQAYPKFRDERKDRDRFVVQQDVTVGHQKKRTQSPAVFRSLLQGGVHVVSEMADRKEFRGMMLTFAMQAFDAKSFKDDLKKYIAKLAPHFDDIILMFDEVTGTEHGHSLCGTLQKAIVDFAESIQDKRIMPVIADASLVNATVFNRWVKSKSHEFPACLMYPSGATGAIVPYRESELVLIKGRDTRPQLSAFCIEANAYPAKNLIVEYELGVTRCNEIEEALKEEKNNICEHLLTIIERELTVKRSDGRQPQVLAFVQNKKILRDLEAQLAARNIEAASLSADVDSEKKDKIMAAACGDKFTTQAVLVTSTASRGIDFPNVTTTICVINGFAPESTMMEIQQALFRSRGSGKDDLNRKIVFVIEDSCVFPPGAQEDALWKKRLFDLASVMLMLRSTFLTRTQGRAGLFLDPKKDCLFAPIGEARIIRTRESSISVLNETEQMLIEFSRASKVKELANAILDNLRVCFNHNRVVFTRIADSMEDFDRWVSPIYTKRHSTTPSLKAINRESLFNQAIVFDKDKVKLRQLPKSFRVKGNVLLCQPEMDQADLWLNIMYSNEQIANVAPSTRRQLLQLERMLFEDKIGTICPTKVSFQYRNTIMQMVDILSRDNAEHDENRRQNYGVKTQKIPFSFVFPLPFFNVAEEEKDIELSNHITTALCYAAEWTQRSVFPSIGRNQTFEAKQPWVVSVGAAEKMKAFNSLMVGREFNLFLRLL